MAPNTDAQRQLVKTTNSVATVLSTDFGIRSGYESVNSSSPSPTTSEPVILGRSETAIALRAFFAQQTGRDHGQSIRMLRGSAAVKVGDIVEITSGVLSPRKLLMISSCAQPRLRGVILVTAASTILHDVVASNELFMTSANTTTSLISITGIVDPDSVRLRYAWDDTKVAFMGLKQWATLEASSAAEDVAYHEGDFVTLAPQDGDALLEVAQVHRIRHEDVYIRRLRRQVSQETGFQHERLLQPAAELERIKRTTFEPLALCHVSLLPTTASSWVTDNNEFYVTQEGARLLRSECALCTIANRKQRQTIGDMDPLIAMEIMCGAGGLSLGLDLCGVCETKYAIDADSDSTKTFQAHHPAAKVYCADAGEALERAVSGRFSAEGMRFPRRGEVDVISAGPPCQGFSRRNQTASREAAEKDPRNLLICTVLGWVDHLRPKYLVVENVEGFTDAKLSGRDQGMVKLTMKSLLDLGYGVTCGYVQSGAFGCPQSRGRFILLAARQGLTLPSLPGPTHHFLGKAAVRFTWMDGNKQSHSKELPSTAAQFPAITVWDAISDLPAFDWKDPHITYEGPDAIELERAHQGIPQLEVIRGQPVGSAKSEYQTRPQNSYQERIRVLGGKMMRRVTQHQTSDYAPHQVERVVNVALEPGANYESWSHPSIDKPALLGHQPNGWRDTHFRFERLDGDRYFKIMMTTATVEGCMLHPTQRRLLTVRECARAQGFPDWVDFHTDAKLLSAYRQIGNAVPIPLSSAIGNSILAARMSDLTDEQQDTT